MNVNEATIKQLMLLICRLDNKYKLRCDYGYNSEKGFIYTKYSLSYYEIIDGKKEYDDEEVYWNKSSLILRLKDLWIALKDRS